MNRRCRGFKKMKNRITLQVISLVQLVSYLLTYLFYSFAHGLHNPFAREISGTCLIYSSGEKTSAGWWKHANQPNELRSAPFIAHFRLWNEFFCPNRADSYRFTSSNSVCICVWVGAFVGACGRRRGGGRDAKRLQLLKKILLWPMSFVWRMQWPWFSRKNVKSLIFAWTMQFLWKQNLSSFYVLCTIILRHFSNARWYNCDS